MNPRLNRNKSRLNQGLVVLVLLCQSVLLNSCFENPTPPELTTRPITVVDLYTITSGGTITDDGGSEIFQKGICVSLDNTPTIQDFFYSIDGVGNADFVSTVALEPNTTFYICAYAVNGAGIGYGNILSFTQSYVEVVIMDFGDITGNEAFMRGRLATSQTVTSRGACWGTSPNPTINDSKTEAGSGSGIFETTLTGLEPGTRYYTRAYAVANSEVFYSDNYEFTTLGYPLLTTKEISNAGTFIISTGGDILSQGLILNAGVCWSTSPWPTIADSKTDDQLVLNSSTGNYNTFNSDPYGLLPATTYYIRSYATNIAGTGYGNEIAITMPDATVYDLDGNPYSAVTIGTQTWLVENLRTTKYANGDQIPNVVNTNEWQNATSGAWCYYENLADYAVPYGKLYNWYAVTDARNVCPAGWHVPTDAEWQTLITFVGGSDVAGNALKETGTAHWHPNDLATNSSGFTALPGGAQSAFIGTGYPANSLGMFWTATPVDGENAYGYYLFDGYQSINQQGYVKQTGLSVRCVKD
ncbi:FISUMP domain-containing protein [Mangrovibacterium lignilyticum]|uniref:FISUMP domain-containing protein n=1 Tax=Mangrovibacterium lignilyticum TaxID=2668052 RepID=UPI0013D0F2F9|nr:FISUMP domain-containing protein [Mangrovibacterium lignilyticum]